MDLVKHALKNMDLEAGDDREFDPETSSLESIELDDIRSNYGIAEKYKYENTEEKLQDMINSHQASIDNNHPDEINVEDEEDAIQWYEDLLQQHKKTGADTFEAPFGGDTAWREKIQQEMEEIDLYKPAEAFRGADNLPEDEDNESVGEGKVKDMAMDQADAFYDKVSSIADETNDIQKAIVDSWNDEEENPPVWALDDAAKDILADAGLLEPEPQEGEMEESEIAEANCPKCGEKRHKLKACASCGCSESFDPKMEPTKKEQIASNMMDGDFETAGALLGSDGASVMDDWYEHCRERGLDVKDALEDIDEVENCVDEMIETGDDKYYPAEMESIEEQEDAVVGKALDVAMVELKKLAGLY